MGRHSFRAVSATVAATAALAAITGTAVAAPAAHVDRVALTIESDTQHGKKDAKGKWHDAYLPAAFSATTGDKVVVTIRNFDPAPHTFTAKKLGLNVVVKPGSAAHPSMTTSRSPRPRPGATPGSALRTATRGR
jgi:Cupredoxin-like domain